MRFARRRDELVTAEARLRPIGDRADRLHGGLKQAKVCWLATEEDEEPAEAADSTGPPTVMILGRIDPQLWKGHRELIEAWPRADKFSRRCFELLRLAYVNARYSPEYKLTDEEIAIDKPAGEHAAALACESV